MEIAHPLFTVFTALILSRIRPTYAISVWGGHHLTNQQRQRINAFLKRARKFGFTEDTIIIVSKSYERSLTLDSLFV